MIKKSLGPLCFTVIVLLFVHFIFELNFTFINSLKSVENEVEMKDIYFSKIQNNQNKTLDTNIVLVDIDTFKRPQILNLLNKINTYQPKVIGVDVLFKEDEEPGSTVFSDYVVYAESHPFTVFACVDSRDVISHSFFVLKGSKAKEGLVNFGNAEEGKPIRSILNHTEKSENLKSFAFNIAELYNPSFSALNKIKEKDKIDITYNSVLFPNEYLANEIINDSTRVYLPKLKGKIVLVGAINDENDKHKIPNTSIGNRQQIYTKESGLKIHATAIAMLLNNTIVSEPSGFWKTVFTILIFLFFFYLLFFLFEKYEFYFKLTGRLVLLFGGIIFLLLYVLLMKSGIEIEIGYWFFMIIIIYEMLEVYHPIMHLIRKGWKSITKKQQ